MARSPAHERILIRGARVITADAGGRVLDTADILIAEGRIAAVGEIGREEDAGCDRVIDGHARLVLPGLVNAHTHSPLSAVHGTYDRLNHRASMWLFQAYTANRTPREVYVSAMLNCIEMLQSGTTAAIDHFPEQAFGPVDVEAVVAAYRDSGMRAQVALRIFDGEYADVMPPGGALPDRLQRAIDRNNPYAPKSVAELRDLCTDAIGRWDGDSGRIGVGPAPSNPMRCSDALLEMCGELSDAHDVAIHCHLLETRVQAEIAQRRYGTTMVKHLDGLGLLSPKLSCAHTIWIGDDDIDLMAERGAVVVHNPESNIRSGAGLAPIPKMLARGVRVALGTDGSCSSGGQVLQHAMRLSAMIHRATESDPSEWIGTHDALRMATAGGAAALRAETAVGAIEAGFAADLVLYDLGRAWWAPVNDPVHQFVQSESGAGADTVIVDGCVLMEDGRITAFDADAILAEAREMVPALRKRNRDLFDLAEEVGRAVL
ncbi:MAG: amidohydrolase family protein [Rhodospirillaceae bacterium]